MNRKDFLVAIGYTCCGAAMAGLFSGCNTPVHLVQNTQTGNKITIRKSEFTELKKNGNHIREYILVKTDKLQFPICLFRHSEEVYTALLMQCTHRGCELKPEGNFLVCPCHGSEFNNEGIVQNPPAEQNLQTFKTTSDNENIYIQL